MGRMEIVLVGGERIIVGADVNDVGKTVSIVPMRVVEATPTATATAPASMGRMEIVLVGGERILVGADVDATALARIIKALTRR